MFFDDCVGSFSDLGSSSASFANVQTFCVWDNSKLSTAGHLLNLVMNNQGFYFLQFIRLDSLAKLK